jgi:large subunit ribosomal protein L4
MEEKTFLLNILNISGEDSGKTLDLSQFDNVEINDHLIYLYIKYYLANQRQGTHKSKERSEIKGSTKKLIRQKGNGGARRGDIKSPILRGGGRVFGPKPNDYNIKMNKKERDLALLSSLKHRLLEKNLNIISDFDLSTPKTKNFISVIENLKINANKNLIVVKDVNKNLLLSSRNIQSVKVKNVENLNVYDIVSSGKILFDEKGIDSLCKRLFK